MGRQWRTEGFVVRRACRARLQCHLSCSRRKSGQQELSILKKLGAADSENKWHCLLHVTKTTRSLLTLSAGSCLYELFTGKVLFPGKTYSDMVRVHMELKGSFSKKMVKKIIKRAWIGIKPKGIASIVTDAGTLDEHVKMLEIFKDNIG